MTACDTDNKINSDKLLTGAKGKRDMKFDEYGFEEVSRESLRDAADSYLMDVHRAMFESRTEDALVWATAAVAEAILSLQAPVETDNKNES